MINKYTMIGSIVCAGLLSLALIDVVPLETIILLGVFNLAIQRGLYEDDRN